MSVDAVGAGAAFELVGVVESSDLGAIMGPVAETGFVAQGVGLPGGTDTLPSVADFQAVMLAAAELCGEVITEVSDHSLGIDSSAEVRDDSGEVASDENDGGNEIFSPIDLGFGPLHPALLDLVKSAAPAQLAEMCSNLQAGIGLAFGCVVDPNVNAKEHGGDSFGLVPGGQETKDSIDVSSGHEGGVQRVVGRDSDVIANLSRGIIDAARNRVPEKGLNENLLGALRPGQTSQVFSSVSAAPDTGSVFPQEATGQLTPEPSAPRAEPIVRLVQKLIPSFGLGAGLESTGAPTDIPLTRVGDVSLTVPVQRTQSPSVQVESPSDFSSTTQILMGGAGGGGISAKPVASPSLVESSGGESFALLSAESSMDAISSGGLRDLSSGDGGDSAIESESPLGVRSDSAVVNSRERTTSSENQDAETAGREGGGQRDKSPSQGISVGWHGRKVVAEPLATISGPRHSEFHSRPSMVGGVALNQQEEVGQAGVDGSSSMTAFALVQRSAGFHRGASVEEARAGERALGSERVAGEVWSRLADSVARVRADRGALRVEIELPQGMSVEVELRGVSGGVNAVFRVGDSGLRQTLETMWSVLPRSEKVSALDLTDVSFERGSSRGSGDLDSRGGRQGAQQGRQERFDGDVRDFERKSSEKNLKLGTPEATEARRAIFSRGFSRVE